MIALLLAAGRGTRMKSDTPKVLFDVNDEPLCFAAFRSVFELCEQVAVIVGYKGAEVKAALLKRAEEVFGKEAVQKKVLFFTQEFLSGTGDAVRTGIKGLGKNVHKHGDVLIVNGDLPLLRPETIKFLLKAKDQLRSETACLSLKMRQPTGLGRILRDERGSFQGIREEKDASSDEKKIKEVNGGVYYFKMNVLSESVQGLQSNNKQNEFYLTDLLKRKNHVHAEAILAKNPWDLFGVNTTFELSIARRIAQTRLQKKLAEDYGVDFLDPGSTLVSARATFLGPCTVGPGTVIKGASVFGKNIELQGMNYIDASCIDESSRILWGSVVEHSHVEEKASVGPMAHLRPQSKVGPSAKVGNFVELKNTRLGRGAKASHLSYLGDADVGEDANIGCGSITCNYDGFQKHETHIGKRVFVGSDTQLIAPVRVGDDAYIGSGTTVTDDVPAGALALSRQAMTIKPGYAKKNCRAKSTKKS